MCSEVMANYEVQLMIVNYDVQTKSMFDVETSIR